MSESICIEPIGIIRSPFKSPGEAPNQGSEAAGEGKLIVDERYHDAFLGLQAGQKIVILYWLHQAERSRLQVHPRRDHSRPLKGVFATRSPHRPNPIAIEVVEVLEIEGTTLTVRGLDALDGTPLLDIKCEV